ncbi:hypothetical protein [Thiohalocapsa sp. ML1]|uniref:hypothetical protein n=1 Tax=Thiohalocapsa sp. ML1 TaxID=1431688 RepID=UPI0012E35D76|nr:hypothetical protein [Thiohalocapsa sp. ML1]
MPREQLSLDATLGGLGACIGGAYGYLQFSTPEAAISLAIGGATLGFMLARIFKAAGVLILLVLGFGLTLCRWFPETCDIGSFVAQQEESRAPAVSSSTADSTIRLLALDGNVLPAEALDPPLKYRLLPCTRVTTSEKGQFDATRLYAGNHGLSARISFEAFRFSSGDGSPDPAVAELIVCPLAITNVGDSVYSYVLGPTNSWQFIDSTGREHEHFHFLFDPEQYSVNVQTISGTERLAFNLLPNKTLRILAVYESFHEIPQMWELQMAVAIDLTTNERALVKIAGPISLEKPQ